MESDIQVVSAMARTRACSASRDMCCPGLALLSFTHADTDHPATGPSTEHSNPCSLLEKDSRRTIRFESTAKVLAESKLKYYRISE